MMHTSRYAFLSTSRLAQDAGISCSAITRLLRGRSSPRYTTLAKLVKCLEQALDHPLDVREVFSSDGAYPTASVCDLTACPGCLPDFVYREDGSRKPGLEHLKSGQWSGDSHEPAKGGAER